MFVSDEKFIKPVTRPSWDEYFLSLVKPIASRSCDANTKHGCVLVDENNHIVGTGYNSFPRWFNDDILPNFRPEGESDSPKYKFMVHSEVNAISNLTTKSYKKLTCYLTGIPCVQCLTFLHQNKVDRIVILDKYGWSKSEEESEYWHTIYYESGIKLETLDEYYQVFELGRWFNWIKKGT